ncbi:MAG TPA: hypothetical protein PKD85_22935 [Saprospiraceae bacterium]|nr:hypothetical protein [Saprospiraceae bacterium]
MGESIICRIYVDGGFVDNELFLNIMERMLDGVEVISSEEGSGSAIGALIVLKK